jgi:3-deoxy-D-arabino-heptulosonate 7-phosphate (DAHP) synthase
MGAEVYVDEKSHNLLSAVLPSASGTSSYWVYRTQRYTDSSSTIKTTTTAKHKIIASNADPTAIAKHKIIASNADPPAPAGAAILCFEARCPRSSPAAG